MRQLIHPEIAEWAGGFTKKREQQLSALSGLYLMPLDIAQSNVG
jgi:hypothetical protein